MLQLSRLAEAGILPIGPSDPGLPGRAVESDNPPDSPVAIRNVGHLPVSEELLDR